MKLFSLIAGATASYYTTESYIPSTELPITSTTYITHTTNGEPIATDCGGRITELQKFSSPDAGDGTYPNRAHCTWTIDIRGVPGFFIKANRFVVEYATNCVFDYVKVVANGEERNFCGPKLFRRRRREAGRKVKEGGKMTPDLVNASNDGFEDIFVLGGQATVSFSSDHIISRGSFELELVEADRLDIIKYHFGRIAASLPEGASWTERYVNRFYKVFNKVVDADNGENCYEENGFGSDDSADDVQVFDESDFCKLNGQVNAALNSWARNNACEGRGKVHRQVIRAARKVRNFYNDKMGC
ncbi:Oidioi.mRNA.OKI2018_I69.chr1.g3915.t1.cds [Oikopleura dioica]|uniref:Oidioi.mRNA.OKI2018_I69.chr1.g3915.t1.cds n=1 Tax=Oikopleura dioica TaxID=34765 RepID=A0ABN7SVA8_OIKDI|nr:Oidioi.mRNA.OKI2018_I69.chr1.g3915.t1.cds [Oikopleura dioica]